jgi:hypothetical protein
MKKQIFEARGIGGMVSEVSNSPLPDDIQWMPPGQQTIIPYVDGEPKEVTIDVNEPLAVMLELQLQQLRTKAAAGHGDVPYIDFNHEDAAASAEVLSLYWGGDGPVKGGIRARVKWTGAGQAALEGRNYRRFSPKWNLDAESMQVVGIETNLGGLVNRAAFKNIQPVVAKLGDSQEARIRAAIAGALEPLWRRMGRLEATQPQVERSARTIKAAQGNGENKPHRGAGMYAHPFYQQCCALAAEKSMPFTQAVAEVQAKEPELFANYNKALNTPDDTLPLDCNHPFLVQARAVAESQGISEAEGAVLVARQNYPLHRQYCDSLRASAKAGRRTLSNPGAEQFIREVQTVAAAGHPLDEAASIVSAKQPQLYRAYRLACLGQSK